jgi:hypothetical protein
MLAFMDNPTLLLTQRELVDASGALPTQIERPAEGPRHEGQSGRGGGAAGEGQG